MEQQITMVRPEMSLTEVALVISMLESSGTPGALPLAGRLSRWLA